MTCNSLTPCRILSTLVTLFLTAASGLLAEVPQLLNYQGRVSVNGVPFDGTGQFKFALVNGAGDTAYWSNDLSLVGELIPAEIPGTAVSLDVVNGLYSVVLGDSALANMSALPTGVFASPDVHLRVWFNDGANGFQLLSPDRRVAAVGYAITSGSMPLSGLYAAPSQPVIGWGKNGDGQSTVPTDLGGVIQIAAGSSHSLALMSDGTVRAWGDDTDDQATVPADLTNVIQVAAGGAHSLALKSDGTVVAWGSPGSLQSTVPGGLSGVKAVAAGQSHSLVLKDDGTVLVFGDNSFSQRTVPGSATNVIAIAAGDDHCLALKGNGTVIAWGRNSTEQSDVPGGLSNVVAIAAGAFHSLAVRANGTVEAWGWDLGQQATVPGDLTGVTAVAGGYSHSLALTSDGAVVGWGDNSLGQTEVPDQLAKVVRISAGAHHSLALRASRVPVEVARLDEDNIFTGKIGIGRTPTTNRLEVEGQASKSIAGNWASNSDRRIKEEILPVNGALEKLQSVRLVSFRYTDDYRSRHPSIVDQRYLNVIAQEFAQVFPDHVRPSGEFLPDGSEILQVDTYPLTIYAAAAVQELNQKVGEQQSELAALREQNHSELAVMQKRLAVMQEQINEMERLMEQMPSINEK